MTEIEIALGAVFAAQRVLDVACKRENEKLEFSVEGSRHKTIAGVNSRELREAYAHIETASRLIYSARSRDLRLIDQTIGYNHD